MRKGKRQYKGSDYFKVLKSWPRGRVAANKILAYFDRGSVAAWPQPLKRVFI